MRTDTGIQAYPLDDGLRIQSLHLSVGVQLIEIADTQSQIGIGEQELGALKSIPHADSHDSLDDLADVLRGLFKRNK